MSASTFERGECWQRQKPRWRPLACRPGSTWKLESPKVKSLQQGDRCIETAGDALRALGEFRLSMMDFGTVIPSCCVLQTACPRQHPENRFRLRCADLPGSGNDSANLQSPLSRWVRRP